MFGIFDPTEHDIAARLFSRRENEAYMALDPCELAHGEFFVTESRKPRAGFAPSFASGLIGNGAMTSVIDTYELSPMQAGMLFHTVSGGDSGVDIEQVVATLHEPLDEARVASRLATGCRTAFDPA